MYSSVASHCIYQKVTLAVVLSTWLLFLNNYYFTLGRLRITGILVKNQEIFISMKKMKYIF